MYAYIRGKIAFRSPTFIHIEANGIGYHVSVSLNTYSKLEEGAEQRVWTYLHVKEDILALYGFYTEEERSVFLKIDWHFRNRSEYGVDHFIINGLGNFEAGDHYGRCTCI